jgi:anti-sigma factor RsiW
MPLPYRRRTASSSRSSHPLRASASATSRRPTFCYSAAAVSLIPPAPIRLVPGLLRAGGLKVSVNRIRDALQRGAVPGRRDDRRRHHWMLTAEDVDAVERYFRELDNTRPLREGAM